MNRELPTRIGFGVAVGLGVGLSVLAFIAVFFEQVLPAALISSIPDSAELIRLVVALLMIGVGLIILRQTSQKDADQTRLVTTATAPEDPQKPPRLVGEQFTQAVADALGDVRLKDVPYNQTAPHQTLYEAVHSAVELTTDSDTSATEVLEKGTWTADPVAAAFLSETVEYPVGFSLLRWAKPGYSYQTAIGRTCKALDGVLTGTQTDSPPRGWLAQLRLDVEGYLQERDSVAVGASADHSIDASVNQSTPQREGDD